MVEVTLIAAFLAGLASFASPCVLPLIPAFLSYLGGVSLQDINSETASKATNSAAKTKIFLNTVFFVLGFVIVFSAFSVAISTVLARISFDLMQLISKVGGVIIILFGLFTLGAIKINFLAREYKLTPGKTRYAYITSFIFGATFAVSWTPCVGAILGSILTLAFTQPNNAFALLFVYSLGLGIPFLLTGAFTAQVSDLIRKHGKFMNYFNKVMGIVLVIIGILVFTGDFIKLANFGIANKFLGG